MNFEQSLRIVSDFPKPGIEFFDISPLLEDPEAFHALIETMAAKVQSMDFNKIAAIESRGFILGSALAQKLGKGFIMVRKKGKLPGKTVSYTYELEYGTDTLEMLPSSVAKDEKILILDDVLATGGTASATYELISQLSGQVAGFIFFLELSFLEGRKKLNAPVESLIIK